MAWKTIRYEWQWQLKSSPEELWPYVADTQRFNQAAGSPVVKFTEIPQTTGGSQRLGQTSQLGIIVKWEEAPYEWVHTQQYSIRRIFKQGPLAHTYNGISLEPNSQGTLLRCFVEATPVNFLGLLGIFYRVGWDARRNFERVFRQIDDSLQNKVALPFNLAITPVSQSGQLRLREFTQQLLTQDYELRWIQRLAELLLTEADLNLVRLRPYVLADTWQAPRRVVLELFLSAAKLGLLSMRWDIMCPLCRGANVAATSLDQVSKGVHCPTCNIDFEADFAQNVELTFSPHPQIRPIYEQTYCIGGPMVTPHILVHQIVEPGETRTLQTKLASAGYHIRTQRLGVKERVELNLNDQTPPACLAIQVDAQAIQVIPVENNALPDQTCQQADEFIDVRLTNSSPYPQQIYIERAAWYTDAATAAQVTTLQHFRDLFSDEVLRPGEEIGVQSMTILFSDLVGSTAMYNRWGDAASYALVREQFAFLQRIIRNGEGAIVKTIGDAIMAAFADPVRGVGAALAIQQEIHSFNAAHPDEPLLIKLGLHQGPCLAVNLNGRLDYFGATVNLASRLEGQGRGGDVVISDKLRRDPAVAELLATKAVRVTEFATAIKGFDENFCLYRLTL
jgi:class 3 adenylate cyclase